MFRQLDIRSWLTFLSRNRLYTAVNFIGLALALAFVLLVADYTARQLTVDSYQTKATASMPSAPRSRSPAATTFRSICATAIPR